MCLVASSCPAGVWVAQRVGYWSGQKARVSPQGSGTGCAATGLLAASTGLPEGVAPPAYPAACGKGLKQSQKGWVLHTFWRMSHQPAHGRIACPEPAVRPGTSAQVNCAANPQGAPRVSPHKGRNGRRSQPAPVAITPSALSRTRPSSPGGHASGSRAPLAARRSAVERAACAHWRAWPRSWRPTAARQSPCR